MIADACRSIAVLSTVALVLAVTTPSFMARPEGLPPGADWRRHIERVDEALAGQNVKAAVEAWREAYAAALGSLRWEGMVDVGDAYLRIGDFLDFRRAFLGDTRASYRAALFRARQERSLEGLLRVTEAFAALGDRPIAEYCLQLAEAVALQRSDRESHARVAAYARRLFGDRPA